MEFGRVRVLFPLTCHFALPVPFRYTAASNRQALPSLEKKEGLRGTLPTYALRYSTEIMSGVVEGKSQARQP